MDEQELHQQYLDLDRRRVAALQAQTEAMEMQARAAQSVAESLNASKPPFVYHRQAGTEANDWQPVPPDQDHPWELWGINEGAEYVGYYWRRPATASSEIQEGN